MEATEMDTMPLANAARLGCLADDLHARSLAVAHGRLGVDLQELANLLVDVTEQMSRMQLQGTSEWSRRDAESGG